jgi:hypothetical protein
MDGTEVVHPADWLTTATTPGKGYAVAALEERLI